MSNFLKAFGLFVAWLCLSFIWYNNFYSDNNIDTSQISIDNKDTLYKNGVILDKPTFNNIKDKTSFASNFIIYKDTTNVILPTNFIKTIDSINNYLNKHSTKIIIITSKYLYSEKDKKTLINYGKIRAYFIRNKLTSAGVNPEQLFIKDTLSNFSYSNNKTYNKGIEFNLSTYTNIESKAIKAQVFHKILYTYFGKKTFNNSASLKTYISNLSRFMTDNPSAKIKIEGHTDSQGTTDSNYWIGLQRAQNVRLFLLKKGIPNKNITILSKGEFEPIGNNSLKEGRAMNRRIEIYIQ